MHVVIVSVAVLAGLYTGIGFVVYAIPTLLDFWRLTSIESLGDFVFVAVSSMLIVMLITVLWPRQRKPHVWSLDYE